MTYAELFPFLEARNIKLRDRQNNPIAPEDAQHRLVDKIKPAKLKADTLVIILL